MATTTRDYYEVLGVPKKATDKDIRAAYRKLARKFHPDLNPGDKAAEEKFKEIQTAYEVLSDPEKRGKYDQFGHNWQHAGQGGFQPGANWPGTGRSTGQEGGIDLGDLNFDPRNIDRTFDTTRFNTISTQQLSSNIRTFSSRFSNLRSDPIKNLGVALIKNTGITERVNLQFRAESFNFTNRPQFSNPNLSAASASFSKVTSQANFARLIQMGLRLSW
jgi:curved DNA-binding protein CbpA